jgi:hypothetical protein
MAFATDVSNKSRKITFEHWSPLRLPLTGARRFVQPSRHAEVMQMSSWEGESSNWVQRPHSPSTADNNHYVKLRTNFWGCLQTGRSTPLLFRAATMK